MNIEEILKKIVNKTAGVVAAHRRLFSLAVVFAITLAVGTAIGMTLDNSQHTAYALSIYGYYYGGRFP